MLSMSMPFAACLQVYRDIPLPSWQVVFPDKLLQFRPLDLLRLDLFGLAGATSVLAQAIIQPVTSMFLLLWTPYRTVFFHHVCLLH
jgi:hypothetical protein